MPTENEVTKDELNRFFDRKLKSAKEQMKQFRKRLDDNPVSALDWSGRYYIAAVAMHEIPLILKWICESNGTPEQTLENIKGQYTRAALQYARRPEHSSGATNNIMAAARSEFSACLAEDLKYRF